ncbi:MAG: hypothetical protein V3T17_17965 [Pseudomonadales bacterium]
MIKQSLALAGLLVLSLSANATLYDRGGSLIYEDVLDIPGPSLGWNPTPW